MKSIMKKILLFLFFLVCLVVIGNPSLITNAWKNEVMPWVHYNRSVDNQEFVTKDFPKYYELAKKAVDEANDVHRMHEESSKETPVNRARVTALKRAWWSHYTDADEALRLYSTQSARADRIIFRSLAVTSSDPCVHSFHQEMRGGLPSAVEMREKLLFVSKSK